MTGPTIGSLFTGTGALDLAVQDVYGGHVVWHSQYEPPDKNGKEDVHQYAAQILARHWPTVPNLGDVTKIDWQRVLDDHGPVDILTGGFPCQDVSSAGKRAGLTADSRSGLWAHMARAIHELQPRLVVIENVQGLLSAKADRGLEPGTQTVDEDPGEGAGRELLPGGILRALGAVLGDLATLGFDAEWARVAASEVGAPHPRKRVFILAWPAAVDPGGFGWGDRQGLLSRLGAAGRDTEAPADAPDLGHERGRAARRRRHGPADRSLAAADTCGEGLEVRRVEPDRNELPAAERGRREPASDADGRGREGHPQRDGGTEDGQPERERGLDPLGCGVRGEAVEPVCPTCGCDESMHDVGGFCAGCHGCTDSELGRPDEAPADSRSVNAERRGVAGVLGSQAATQLGEGDQRERTGHAARDSREALSDPAGVERGEGWPEPARLEGRPDAAQCGGTAPADTDQRGRRADVLDLRPGQPDVDWGDYGPAIRRWEHILGRPAPWPTDALGRLSPVFTEWLMGLPDGWVTDTPGLTRPAMLRALGNGVVRLQAATALRLLHDRAFPAARPAAA